MTTLPENILRCMSPKDRVPMGKAGMTSAEATARYEKKVEKTTQIQIEDICRQRNLFFCRMPWGRKSVWPGFPDFLIVLPGGKTLLVEVKTDSGKLSDEQKKFFERYQNLTGDYVRLVRSLEEFRKELEEATKTKEI